MREKSLIFGWTTLNFVSSVSRGVFNIICKVVSLSAPLSFKALFISSSLLYALVQVISSLANICYLSIMTFILNVEWIVLISTLFKLSRIPDFFSCLVNCAVLYILFIVLWKFSTSMEVLAWMIKILQIYITQLIWYLCCTVRQWQSYWTRFILRLFRTLIFFVWYIFILYFLVKCITLSQW